jgi:uncharacterized membrane protein YdbT with pleckstrin-like domain
MTQKMDQILGEKDELIWKDRKRYLGLPISFTRYSIRGIRFYMSKGLFNTEENEILLYRIMDVKYNRTLADRIFGVGTITLYSADATDNEMKIIRVKKSAKVRDLISKMVEDERVRVRARGKELFGVGDQDMDGAMDVDIVH